MSDKSFPPSDDDASFEPDDEDAVDAQASPDSTSSSDEDDDRVGYKRPPKEHRFQPKESGNLKGRPKGAKGMKSILRKEFTERVRVTENGKTRTISKMELMVKRLSEKGAKGDLKAITKLIDLGVMVFGTEDEVSGEPVLTADEQAIIDVSKRRRRAMAGSGKSTRKAGGSKPRSRPLTKDTKGDRR